mgnify:CR=1 FL=1
MKNFTNFFISLAFVGYIKTTPGTFASLFSILFLFPFFYFKILSIEIFLIIFVLIFLISLYLISLYSKKTNTQDSGIIVIDEFIGIFLIFLFYDNIYLYNNLLTIILIFFLFRFFDIIKFFPANIIDKKMLNSLGVILDDIVAAIYTILSLYLINVFIQ